VAVTPEPIEGCAVDETDATPEPCVYPRDVLAQCAIPMVGLALVVLGLALAVLKGVAK